MLKRTGAFFLALLFALVFFPRISFAENQLTNDAQSYILMDAQTGAVLSEKDADKPLACANVIKTMSLLLFLEAIDSGKLKAADKVTVSKTAAGKGGTSVFLDAEQSYKAGDLLKAVIINSANDACVALAEQVAGSEEDFVKQMNERATELGAKGSKFVNCTGLDAEGQVTTARDMALISRELVKHTLFFKYSSIWIENFVHEGGRTTEMVNSNRLVRYYEGCDGIKTGSSAKAGYCIVATAKKSGGRFIYVGLGSKNSDTRFEGAKKAFDYAFSNYASKSIVKKDTVMKEGVGVSGGDKPFIDAYAASDLSVLVPKGKEAAIEKTVTINEGLAAPLESGQVIGKLTVTLDGNELGSVDIICKQPVVQLEYQSALQKILDLWLH